MDIKSAAAMAMKNKERIKDSDNLGCYYCQKTFSYREIKEWTDNTTTALCPYCNVDAVVENFTTTELKQAYEYWFVISSNR